MSLSKKFFERKFGADSMTPGGLQRLRDTVLSEDVVPDSSVFKCRKKRLAMHKNNPDSFLSVSKNGTPVFPIRNQFGGMSYTILKRGISAAKTAHARTGDAKYLDIIQQLEADKRAMETKISKVPETYHPQTKLVDELKRYE